MATVTRAFAPLFALLAIVAAPLAGARAACAPVELLYDENENIHEKRVDHNKDCTYDEIVYYASGTPERAEKDTDLNGAFDIWIYYGRDGNPSRQEQDTTGDGKADRWIQYKDGIPSTQLDDKNADGKVDTTLNYAGDLPERLEEDTNFDGRPDRITTYKDGAVAAIEALTCY